MTGLRPDASSQPLLSEAEDGLKLAAAAIQASAKERAWLALICAALMSRGSLASSQSIESACSCS
jgi:hypothetical protein